MTARELIEYLTKMPPDAPVVIGDHDMNKWWHIDNDNSAFRHKPADPDISAHVYLVPAEEECPALD